ncbi:hypothetical protein SUGI_0374900 [Cryptomeria japonica]|nr:hypothetical protein SUGI_0374900 [Cryptomeria japonica]
MLRTHQPNISRWTRLEIHTSSKLRKGVTDAVLCNDWLYCTTHKHWGILKMFDLKESLWKDLAVKRPRIFTPWWYGRDDEESCNDDPQEPKDTYTVARKRIWIFKLDSVHMKLIELNAIQVRILFLSNRGSKSVQATERGKII